MSFVPWQVTCTRGHSQPSKPWNCALGHDQAHLAGTARRFVASTYRLGHIRCMAFEQLVEIVSDEPVFETSLLLAGTAG